MKAYIILFLCFVSFITSCSPRISEGEIINKQFSPAYTQILVLPVFLYTGKTSTVIFLPMFIAHPDSYRINIKAFNDNEWKERTLYLSKEVYEKVSIGDWFITDCECKTSKDCSDQEPQVVKRRATPQEVEASK